METQKALLKDADGKDVDEHLYRSMIGSLMYLTSSRPDIMFAVCACAGASLDRKSTTRAVTLCVSALAGCYIPRTITVKGKPFNTEHRLNEYSQSSKKEGGYHQIQMAEGDEDKTTFFVGEGVFCYRKMPFGLKNAGATYQRLVDKVFHDQIGRNLEAYVDDMVIKSTSEEEMLADIKETFDQST
ncbi:reverse transcriptase domain-containing protein [Tanacetum coccineum]